MPKLQHFSRNNGRNHLLNLVMGKDVEWFYLVQNRSQCWAIVKSVMNIWVP
jgi:hypothetical protein